MEMTTFEDIVTSKILVSLGDYTIGHPTMISNIIREEMIKYNVKPIGHIDEEKLDELSENWNINYALHPHMEDYEEYNRNDVVEAFKYGYRKAKEE